MAGTKFAYVRNFELPDTLLPETYMVLRLDGHAFHRLSKEHNFAKPNDERALQLMDHAARDVMNEFKDIVLAFGESDEYSFLFRRSTSLYNRRHAKILTTVTSLFTSSYVYNWQRYLPETPLKYTPSFDGRITLYPSETAVRDYFSWRQADTHINNLHNTTFWALVLQGGETVSQAHKSLLGTVSSQKQEMLFSRFGINYSTVPPRYRKGSVIVREEVIVRAQSDSTDTQGEQDKSGISGSPEVIKRSPPKPRKEVCIMHCDIMEDEFWNRRPHLLA